MLMRRIVAINTFFKYISVPGGFSYKSTI